jgi:hypothetical protein
MTRKELYSRLPTEEYKLALTVALAFFNWTELNVEKDPLFEGQYITLKKRNLNLLQIWDLFLEEET